MADEPLLGLDLDSPKSEMTFADDTSRLLRRRDLHIHGQERCAVAGLALLSALICSLLIFFYTMPDPHQAPLTSQRTLRFGSWNLRYDGRSREPVPIPPQPGNEGAGGRAEGELPWAERRSKVADQVLWEDLDVVGFQEALTNQVEDLAVLLGNGYSWVGVGRDDGQQAGEYVPIFFKTSRLLHLSTTHFWLSTTPSVPGSISWDAGQTRMATLVHFRDLSVVPPSPFRQLVLPDNAASADLWVLNTHWDDRGLESRTQAAKVILGKVNEVLAEKGEAGAKGKLVVLLGDLNSPSEEEGYATLTGHTYSRPPTSSPPSSFASEQTTFRDTRHSLSIARPLSPSSAIGTPLLHSPFGEKGTFTGFNPLPQNTTIDFVLFLGNGVVGEGAKPGWRVSRYGVIPNQFWDGRGRMYISDHRLVVAAFELIG